MYVGHGGGGGGNGGQARMGIGVPGAAWGSQEQMGAQQAAYQQQLMGQQAAALQNEALRGNALIDKLKRKRKMDNEAIPDVSLVRVAKWVIVLFLAMALGNRFWALFGDKIVGKVHQALDKQP